MVIRTTGMAARRGTLGTPPRRASGRYRTKDPTRLGQYCIATSPPHRRLIDREIESSCLKTWRLRFAERSETHTSTSGARKLAKNEVFPAQRRAGASNAETNTGLLGNLPMLALGRSFTAELRNSRPEISKKLSKWHPRGRKQTNQTRSI